MTDRTDDARQRSTGTRPDPESMTTARPRTNGRSRTDTANATDAQTLADVSHTNPHTGRTFGGNFTFARGGLVAADGGTPDVVPEDGEGDDEEPETLKDVEHTPPNESEDANRVFERGDEHDDDDVAEDE